jgi:pyruvate/2-oxoglutarate dehydrogenase complex dihydrolipoamide dehydrogenase (E3) component
VGSRPFVPPVPGLGEIEYLTNETIFEKAGDVRELIVLGGGPIGVEMAQAFARLGAKVSLVEMGRMLPRDDVDAVALVRHLSGTAAAHGGATARSAAQRRPSIDRDWRSVPDWKPDTCWSQPAGADFSI